MPNMKTPALGYFKFEAHALNMRFGSIITRVEKGNYKFHNIVPF